MNSIILTCPQCETKNKVPAIKQHLNPKCGKCKNLLPMARAAVAVELSDQTIGQAISEATLPLVLDFFSPTCGPCRTLTPVIANLARQFFGRAIIAKIDTSMNPYSAQRYGIRGVPTLIFLKNGQIIDQIVGALPEQALAARISSLLAA